MPSGRVDLVVLVTLSGKEDNVIFARLVYRVGDRLFALFDDAALRAVADSADYVEDYPARMLAPAVVRGYHGEVGELRGYPPHLGALRAVAVAAAAEDGYKPSAPSELRPESLEDEPQRVGRVRVVNAIMTCLLIGTAGRSASGVCA